MYSRMDSVVLCDYISLSFLFYTEQILGKERAEAEYVTGYQSD